MHQPKGLLQNCCRSLFHNISIICLQARVKQMDESCEHHCRYKHEDAFIFIPFEIREASEKGNIKPITQFLVPIDFPLSRTLILENPTLLLSPDLFIYIYAVSSVHREEEKETEKGQSCWAK
jgi:hypothetical protein